MQALRLGLNMFKKVLVRKDSAAAEGGCNSMILRLFAFVCVCSRLRAFICVLGPFFREPENCVCLRLRAFVCVQHPLLLHPLLRHPEKRQNGTELAEGHTNLLSAPAALPISSTFTTPSLSIKFAHFLEISYFKLEISCI